MELTGKCKKEFNKWKLKDAFYKNIEKYPDSMKWGVYVEFFENEGTHIGNDGVNSYWVYRDTDDIEFEDLENITEAINKANDIYNA